MIAYDDAIDLMNYEEAEINYNDEKIEMKIRVPLIHKEVFEMYKIDILPLIEGDMMATINLPDKDIAVSKKEENSDG